MLLDLPQNIPKKPLTSRQKLKKALNPMKKLKENCETQKKSKKKTEIQLRKKCISKKASITTLTTQSKTLEKDSFSEDNVENFEATVIQKSPDAFYLEKIFENFKKLEAQFTPKCCLKHHAIDDGTRGKMVDWMIEVLFSLQCSEDSLFLAVSLMDRFLAATSNFKLQDLHLIGIVCIFISAKYEEVFPIKLETIVEKVAHGKFSKEEIKNKELEILETLDFQVFGPNLNKMLAVTTNRLISQGIFEPENLCLFEKAVAYFGKMVLYDYSINGNYGLRSLTSGVLYTSLKLVETVCQNMDFMNKITACKEIIGIEINEMTEISNEIFALTQKFDQTFPNNNLKKVSVDFYLEMKNRRNK